MKKLLALVLALVMSMSLVTISNAAFKDADSIDYKEAVDVMNAVGVFVGDEKGNFNAKENLTREQAAKIIAYLELGSKAADALVGGATFTDVASSRWSAGFVGYCAQAGIVSGVGDSKFDPAGQLTALQFGKMLLVEIGYDAKAAGMTGTDWAINTSKLLATTGLMNGIDGSVNQVLTREKAAQMTLNALKAPTVEYTTKGSSIIVNGAEINLGASEPTYVTNTIAKQQTISKQTLTNNGGYTIELGEKLYQELKLNRTSDDFGRPSNEWFYKAAKVGAYADKADLTYTAGVKAGTIYTDLGLGKKIDAENVALYVNGTPTTNTVNIAKGVSTKIGAVGNGVLTEVFYDDDNNTAIITQIVTYYGEVQKTVKATATKDAYIVINPDGTKQPANFKANFETDEKFEDDAVVYYTFSETAKEIKSVGLAEVVSGVVTEAQNKKIENEDSQNVTIDGTQYKAGYAFVGEEVSSTMVKGEYDVYLDSYGYMIKIEEVGTLSSNYALVLDISDAGVFTSKQAQLLFADGTVKVVNTAKDYKTYDGKNLTNTIVTYREDDGVYTLKAVSTTVAAANMDGTTDKLFKLETGKATVSVKDITVTTNSATQFVTYDAADDEAAAYTGTKNSPSIEAKGTANGKVSAYYYCKNNNKMVTVMFILCDDAIVSGATNRTIFFARESRSNLISNSTGTYFKYNAVVNGEMKTVMVDDACSGASDLNGLYKSYTLNSKGVITGLTAYEGADLFASDKGEKGSYLEGVGVDKTSKDYTVTLDTKNVLDADGNVKDNKEFYVITVDEKAAIYAIDQDGNITESSYRAIAKDANDKVFAYVDDYVVKSLFIQDVEDGKTEGPSINAANYEVDYGAAGAVKVYYYTGEKHDDNTLIDVILSVLKDDGYTKFEVSSDGATPAAQYTIKATKGYVNTEFTFKNDSSSVIESVKIKLDGVSMLAEKNAKLNAVVDANGDPIAKGAHAKGTDKNGGDIAMTALNSLTIADGAAYESGYYKVTLTGTTGVILSEPAVYLRAGETSKTVTLTNGPATGWTGYYATGSATNLKVVSSKSTDDTKVAFTIVADAAFGADTPITIGYAH